MSLIDQLPQLFQVKSLGYSVEKRLIQSVTFGTGSIQILGWSQMHGNESTTTKALFDLFRWFAAHQDQTVVKHLLNACTFTMIPMLNPDGAEAYTRVNANQVDLNRDAQKQDVAHVTPRKVVKVRLKEVLGKIHRKLSCAEN